MTQVTPRFFFINPYLHPSTPHLYGNGYGFVIEKQGYIIKPMVCSAICTKKEVLDIKYYMFFIVTAATTSSKTTRPQHAHDPKQRKAQIECGERELQENGRR